MAQNFSTKILRLSNQTVTATGNNLYVNSNLVAGSSGVASLNNQTGALSIVGAGLTSVTTNGNTITVSGFSTTVEASFITGVPSGSNNFYVNFPTGFANIPIILTNVQIGNSNNVYSTVLSSPSATGFNVQFSNTVNESGVNLEVYAIQSVGPVPVTFISGTGYVFALQTDLVKSGGVLLNDIIGLSGIITGGGSSSNFVNVKNFGAVGDGITNDTFAIQTAINYYQNNNNLFSALYFPPLNFFTTGILWVTGNNLNFYGFGGASIVSTGTQNSGDYQKVYFNNCSNVIWDGVNFSGAFNSGQQTNVYSGMITASGTNFLTIKNSAIAGTAGVAILFNGSNYAPLIQNNHFTSYGIGIYSQVSGNSNLGGTGRLNKSRIVENHFIGTQGDANYFTEIKLQTPFYDGTFSRGHLVSHNTIVSNSLLGIEFWGNLADSIVSNNYIEGPQFGISIANASQNVVVANNSIKGCGYQGIEIADSTHVTVQGNSIDGSSGNYDGTIQCITQYGIIPNGQNNKPNHINIVGNVVRNCQDNIHTSSASYLNIVGNTLISSGNGANVNFYNQLSSNVNFSNNKLTNYTGNYFIFIDATSNTSNTTGITIANNDLAGAVGQWGIIYYNNNLSGNNGYVLIENNRTYEVTYCQYGMIDTSDNTPINFIHRNNVGQTGGLGYSIADQTYPIAAGSVTYGTTNVSSAFQYYNSLNYTIPGAGVTGNGIWICVFSGGGGTINNVRLNVINTSAIDNNATNLEIWASMNPYVNKSSIALMPSTSYGNPLISKIRTDNAGLFANNQIWLKLNAISTGSSGQNITIYSCSEQGQGNNNLTQIPSTYTEPIWGSISSLIDVINYNEMSISYGMNFSGYCHINTTKSGELDITAPNGVGFLTVPTASSANAGGDTIPATAAGFMTVNITGGSFKIPYFNV